MRKNFEMKKVREKKRGAKRKKNAKPGRKRKEIKGKKLDAVLQAVSQLKKNKGLAEAAGMSEATFYRLMQHDQGLKDLIGKKKEEAVDLVEVSAFQAAMGFEYYEITEEPRLTVTRQKNGVKEEVVIDEKLVVTNRVRKLFPPNQKLVELILYNKRRKDYKQRSLLGSDPENPLPNTVWVVPMRSGSVDVPVVAK